MHIFHKAGVFPFPGRFHQNVLYGIVMDVLYMAGQIYFISDQVLLKAPLPNIFLPCIKAGSSWNQRMAIFGHKRIVL